VGGREITLTLASADGVLTGTASDEEGSGEIEEGKVEGNRVSWNLPITKPMSITLQFDGVVEGGNVSGKVKAGIFPSFPFSGTRA
jgi:hypothetical protein